jgi:hypothetical protein
MLRALAVPTLLLLCGCALRPRYEELTSRFVPQDAVRSEVLVQVVDRNNAPVPGARIEIGDRHRFRATTDGNGIFRLPVEKKYSEENALVVVVLPRGVNGYKLVTPGHAAGPPDRIPLVPSGGGSDAGVTTM